MALLLFFSLLWLKHKSQWENMKVVSHRLHLLATSLLLAFMRKSKMSWNLWVCSQFPQMSQSGSHSCCLSFNMFKRFLQHLSQNSHRVVVGISNLSWTHLRFVAVFSNLSQLELYFDTSPPVNTLCPHSFAIIASLTICTSTGWRRLKLRVCVTFFFFLHSRFDAQFSPFVFQVFSWNK